MKKSLLVVASTTLVLVGVAGLLSEIVALPFGSSSTRVMATDAGDPVERVTEVAPAPRERASGRQWLEEQFGGARLFHNPVPTAVTQPSEPPALAPVQKLLLRPEPAASQAARAVEPPGETLHATAVVIAGALNMRDGPTAAAPVIRSYHRDTLLDVLERNEKWVKVRHGETGETGWMHASYLRVVQ